MAIYVSTDAKVLINSVDYSALVKKVSLDYKRDAVETTAMGPGARAYIGGLFAGTLALDFNQDLAAGGLYQTLWALFTSATAVTTFEVRGTSAVAGASNPKFTGSVCISELPPLDSSVGDLAGLSVSWNATGIVALGVS